MSRKQLALFRTNTCRSGAERSGEKIKPAGAMAQSGDVYRLDRQSADHLY